MQEGPIIDHPIIKLTLGQNENTIMKFVVHKKKKFRTKETKQQKARMDDDCS